MPANTPTPPAPSVDVASLIARHERASKIVVSADAPRTPPGQYGSAYVTTGARMVGDEQEDLLVIVDGSTRTGFPQSAIAVGILYNVVPRDLIRALWAAADAAAK